jgi:hypothetical protein
MNNRLQTWPNEVVGKEQCRLFDSSFRVSGRADAYRQKADQCEAAAARVRDQDIRSVYLAVAEPWRRMAKQQDAIDTALASRWEHL